MDKAIAEIAKALKDASDSLALCLQQTIDVLSNHEKRLQQLEEPDFIAKHSEHYLQATNREPRK